MKIFSTIAFFAVAVLVLLPLAAAQPQTWAQTDWSGGPLAGSVTNHISGWNEFNDSGNVNWSISPGNLVLKNQTATAYFTSGNLTSSVFDAGGVVQWGNISWNASLPKEYALTWSTSGSCGCGLWPCCLSSPEAADDDNYETAASFDVSPQVGAQTLTYTFQNLPLTPSILTYSISLCGQESLNGYASFQILNATTNSWEELERMNGQNSALLPHCVFYGIKTKGINADYVKNGELKLRIVGDSQGNPGSHGGYIYEIDFSPPLQTSITFQTRTSNNLVDWSAWQGASEYATTDTNTLALWHFNDSITDGYWNDSSGNNKNVALGGTTQTTGIAKGAAYFDGSDALDLSPAGNIEDIRTIEFWWKPGQTITPGWGGSQAFFWKSNGDSFYATLQSDGRIKYNIQSEEIAPAPIFIQFVDHPIYSTTNTWSPNQWYHLAFVYGSGGMRLYVNGLPEGSNSYIGLGMSPWNPLIFGKSRTNTNFLIGTIDELRVSNVERIAEEFMKQLYYKTTESLIISPLGRYIQYRTFLSTENSAVTPVLHDVTILYVDTPPSWDFQSQNNSQPLQGEAVKLSAYWTDNINLSTAVLSTNESGIWQNQTCGAACYGSLLTLIGNESWSNFTWQNVSVPQGTTVGWRIWTNDSSGNWNATSIMAFKVKVPAPSPPPSPAAVNISFVPPSAATIQLGSTSNILVNVSNPTNSNLLVPLHIGSISTPELKNWIWFSGHQYDENRYDLNITVNAKEEVVVGIILSAAKVGPYELWIGPNSTAVYPNGIKTVIITPQPSGALGNVPDLSFLSFLLIPLCAVLIHSKKRHGPGRIFSTTRFPGAFLPKAKECT